ncbi:MAG: hypothetical protein WCI11_11265 [Candidatus Methylumidiphilus sp.]
MPNNKRNIRIEDILLLTTLVMLFYYRISHTNALSFSLILIIITFLTLALKWTPLGQKLQESDLYLSMIQNFKVSSFFIIAGLLLASVSNNDISVFEVWLTSAIYVSMLLCSGIYCLIDQLNKQGKRSEQQDERSEQQDQRNQQLIDIIASNAEALNRSNIKGFDELLTTIGKNKGNVLLVAGNLLSLKTIKGIKLLMNFLDQHPSNVLKIVVPASSRKYINELKDNVDAKYLERISVTIQKPFWFLQGIVIIGKAENCGDEITPIGCYYYKSIFSDAEAIAEDGVYIDLSSQPLQGDYCQSVCAYYSLLNNLTYRDKYYFVNKDFSIFDETTKIYKPYNAIIEKVKTIKHGELVELEEVGEGKRNKTVIKDWTEIG